jgi:hypothetical protein
LYRGKCLEWLDFLGKWSLSGFYAFTIFMLFGNKDFDSQDSIVYSPNFYRFYVKSKPLTGAYIGLGAMVLSQILNSVILYFHRYKELDYHRKKSGLARRVRKIQFYDKDLSEKFTISRCGSIFVTSALLGLIPILILGIVKPILKVEERTIFSPQKTTLEHSLISIIERNLSSDPDLSILWIIFVILATVLPILTIIFAFVLWRYHLSKTCQRRMFYLMEILASLSSLEVFVVAVIGAIYYLKYIGKHFLNCEIHHSIVALFNLGPCVDINGEVHPSYGFMLPIAAVVWMYTIYSISLLINRVLLPQSFQTCTIECYERCGVLLKTKKES